MSKGRRTTAGEAANTTWKRTQAAEAELRRIVGPKYSILHRGWPDIVALRHDTRTYHFIECKRISEKRKTIDRILSPDQDEIRSILDKITTKDMRYEIWFFEDKKGSTRIVEKALCSRNRLLPYWNIAGDYD